jgi:hypothetical protein
VKNSDLVRECVAKMEAEGRVRDVRVRPEVLTASRTRGAKETEAQFQKRVIEYAHSKSWRVAHFRHAMTGRTTNGKPKFVTPVAADGKGFLDLLLVRERLVTIELKVKPNKLTAEQREWMRAYERAGVECHAFYPEDWDTLVEVLK